MGFFKKLLGKATSELGLDSIKETIEDIVPGASDLEDTVNTVKESTSFLKKGAAVISEIVDVDDDDLDDDDLDDDDLDDDDLDEFDDDFDEDDYEDELEESDDDLAEFGERVDALIEENDGELDDDDLDDLADEAQEYGISREEFEKMLDARISEINAAIDAGYDRHDVYRTRSVWRRCPRCGFLNYANDVYCDWCGYQLRHKAVSAMLGALVCMGAKGGTPKKLHKISVKRTAEKTTRAKKTRIENKARGIKPAKKSLVSSKSAAPASSTNKKSLFGSSSSASKSAPEKKKSLFGSSSSASKSVPEKKKSLFGSSSSSSKSSSEKKSSLFGSSSSSSKSSSGKKSSLFGGASSGLKKGGLKLGGKRR